MKVYMSVEEGWAESPPSKYISSKRIVGKLDDEVDLHLVHPRDYSLEEGTVARAFRWVDGRLELRENVHEPQGDVFLIYGDETSKNWGLRFGRDQYAFLRRIRDQGNFSHFMNSPEAEEAMLKDGLVDLLVDPALSVAMTAHIGEREGVEMLFQQYGSLVLKPIFGCASAGVRLVDSIDEMLRSGSWDDLQANYVVQEPLNDDELRVILLGGKYLGSRQDRFYQPWDPRKPLTFRGEPTASQLDAAKGVAAVLGAEVIGVDFMGEKIYECNGTGTGLVAYDYNGKELFDYTDNFVRRVTDYGS